MYFMSCQVGEKEPGNPLCMCFITPIFQGSGYFPSTSVCNNIMQGQIQREGECKEKILRSRGTCKKILGYAHRKLINAVHTYYVMCYALVYVPAHNLVHSFQLPQVLGKFAADVVEAGIYTDGKQNPWHTNLIAILGLLEFQALAVAGTYKQLAITIFYGGGCALYSPSLPPSLDLPLSWVGVSSQGTQQHPLRYDPRSRSSFVLEKVDYLPVTLMPEQSKCIKYLYERKDVFFSTYWPW